MFLQNLLRWFQKRRASSWNRLYAEAPVFVTGASAYCSVDREKNRGCQSRAIVFSLPLDNITWCRVSGKAYWEGEATV